MTRSWVRCDAPFGQGYTAGEMHQIVNNEGRRWHVSVSAAGRYPTWDELADARYDLLPARGLDMAMILPPLEDYVNLAPGTGLEVFHLWEIRDPGLPIERRTGQPRSHVSGLVLP